MSMADLEQAFQLIDGIDNADFHGPKAEALIVHAEQALGLTFPPTYRQFLSRFGCGAVSPHEFYGLVDDDFENSSVPDAVWLTLQLRRTTQLARSLVLVSETGDGGYYAIDTSQVTAAGEGPVVEWWPGLPNAVGNGRTVCDDFGSFLLQRIQESS